MPRVHFFPLVCQLPSCQKVVLTNDPRQKFCSKQCAHRSFRYQGSLEEHLWSHVNRCAHGYDCIYCCWEWTGTRQERGYGMITHHQVTRFAHVWAYMIGHGRSIPHGIQVLHHCDNPPCCNPWHLWLGTQRDNVHDAMHKGRLRAGKTFGERHPSARVTTVQVEEIRSLVQQGMRYTEIARQFGIAANSVRSIALKKTRVHG